jgi:hypothetical protein
MVLLKIIPAKRKFHFRTKDIKSIINSKEWDIMHLQCSVNNCDYPNRFNNRDCGHTSNLECEDCRVYKLGLYRREREENLVKG